MSLESYGAGFLNYVTEVVGGLAKAELLYLWLLRFAHKENLISNAKEQSLTLRKRLDAPAGFVRSKWARVARLMHERRYVRYSLLILNVILVLAMGWFVIKGEPEAPNQNASAIASSTDTPTDPLDQVSSADIAVNLAHMASIPETIAIQNQADSAGAELLVPPTDTVAIAKPQTIATALKSRKDIQTYVVQPGESVSSIATKFGVTSDSIMWSNDLTDNNVPAGRSLYIPPVNGIVYTVKAGDTPDSLAAKFKSNRDQIILYNDAEIGGLKPGELILIPGGQKIAPVVYSAWSYYGSYTPRYGANGYDYGFCTWYAATKVPVPSNWGNANTWDNLAPLAGWTVSSAPRVGAVAQSDRGALGHVGYVEAVSPDGTMIKYSDMNGLAGYGRVGYSDWVPASHYAHYIYR